MSAVFANKSTAPAEKRNANLRSGFGNLRVGEPDDAFEREADQVADKIMMLGHPKVNWSLSRMSIAPPLQRKCACGGSGRASGECEECKKKQEDTDSTRMLQRKAAGPVGSGVAPPIVHEVLTSPGQPLNRATREFFEPRFGENLSDVRIHTDARAGKSAAAVDALAYTVGSHVVLGSQISLGSPDTLALLAHELVHVQQQRGGFNRAPLTIIGPNSDCETDAEQIVPGILAGSRSFAFRKGTGLMRMPVVNAGNGTTEELQREIDRLRQEIKTAPASEQDAYTKKITQLETYLAERSDSKLGDCPFSLLFDGGSLRVSGSLTADYPAVSGEPKDGKFDYSPEKQRSPGGPIPEGEYWITPAQLKQLRLGPIPLSSASSGPWGNFRITIHPFSTTHTFGRGGFFIHGGSVPGSIGCIDLTNQMDSFATLIQGYMASFCKAKLRVSYPHAVPDPEMRLPKGAALA